MRYAAILTGLVGISWLVLVLAHHSVNTPALQTASSVSNTDRQQTGGALALMAPVWSTAIARSLIRNTTLRWANVRCT